MWTREELKYRAKNILRGNYWKAFLVSLVITLVAEGTGGSSGRAEGSRVPSNGVSILNHFNINFGVILAVIFGLAAAFIVTALLLDILVFNPLEVGGRRFFVRSAQYLDSRRCFRYAFDGQNYLGIVGTMAVRNIFLFLWTLLLIIPGIVKSYAYRMVPYILADNPNIGTMRAIELSNRMTYGHKLDMFILDLSFIGWYILGALCFGIGIFFVKPYEHATNAELYLTLRQNAIERGDCSPWELNLYDPAQEGYNI